jgi:hypothetical protein
LRIPIIEVKYEDIVANQESETRRLLEHLDLSWDARCLAFHRNPRYVPTASVEQVRQPMYAKSVGRWRNYAKHLEPIARSLRQSPVNPQMKAAG